MLPITIVPQFQTAHGWSPGPGERAARCVFDRNNPNWDYQPRVVSSPEWDTLNETNSIVPAFRMDSLSKDVVRLDLSSAWRDYFIRWQTPELFEACLEPGMGWFDLNKGDGELKFNPLKCSTNLVNITGEPYAVNGQIYVPVESMYFDDGPDWNVTPETHPHLFIKQVVVTKIDRNKVHLQKWGDMFYPFVSNVPLVMRANELEAYPPGYSFAQYKVYYNGGLVDEMVNGLEGDYTADERDRRGTSILTCPPPWIGRMYPETW